MKETYTKLGTVYTLPNYSASLQYSKVALSLKGILEEQRSAKYIISSTTFNNNAYVRLQTAIARRMEAEEVEVKLDPLFKEINDGGDEYRMALEIIAARMSVMGVLGKVLLDKSMDSDICIYYLPELDRFFLYSWTDVSAIVESFANVKYINDTHKPDDYLSYNPLSKPARTVKKVELYKKAYISDIKLQVKNIKVSYGHNSIERYDAKGWFSKLSEDVGRTPGSTIGGILRRIRTGSFIPKDAKLYIFQSKDGDRAIMTLCTNDSKGNSFFVPDQSIQMYIDLIKDKFGFDNIQYFPVN